MLQHGKALGLGKDSLSSITLLYGLGRVAQALKQYDDAEQCYKESLALAEKGFGHNSRFTAIICMALANLFEEQDKTGESLDMWKRALTIKESQPSSDQDAVSRILYAIAVGNVHLRDFKAAEDAVG